MSRSAVLKLGFHERIIENDRLSSRHGGRLKTPSDLVYKGGGVLGALEASGERSTDRQPYDIVELREIRWLSPFNVQ